MNRLFLFLLLGATLCAIGQPNPFVQQAGNFGLLLTDNGKVYAWGSNEVLTSPGLLGTGSAESFLTSPEEVVFPQGTQIRQISAGHRGHFLALDCEGHIWAWGLNEMGQLGDGTPLGLNGIVTTPSKVLSGVMANTSFDDGGFLTGVKFIHAGTNSSFAILNNGQGLSWGMNDDNGSSPFYDANGILGNGDEVSQSTPVLIVDGSDDEPLEGLVQITTTDNTAYGLVDDNQDGRGTIYSWGRDVAGTLGRNMDGTDNADELAQDVSSLAFPVVFDGGVPLTDITEIATSPVFGMGLDVDGFIWSWGNGA